MKKTLNYFIFFSWLTTLFITLNAHEQRDLIIILDQEASIGEANPTSVWCLRSVMASQASPILVNTNLLQDLMQRYYEFGHHALEQGSPEQFMLSLHITITNRLEYWSKFFNQHIKNFATVGSLAQEKVKEELNQRYRADQKIDYQDIDNFIFYLINENKERWSIYAINNHFCLLIPNDYVKTSSQINDETNDALLGFNISKFQRLQDPFSLSPFTFIETERPEFELLHVLEQLFAPTDYRWNILLFGHGLNRKIYNAAHTFEHMIADLSIEEFQQILRFFNNNIKTNLFLYQTCFGAGKHLEQTYQDCKTKEEIILNYPIIVINLTDVPSYSKILAYGEAESFNELNLANYRYNLKKKQWEFLYEFNHPWKKLVKLMRGIDFVHYTTNMDKFAQVLFFMSQQFLENTPQLRLAEHNSFMSLYNFYNTLEIDQTLIEVKKISKTPLIISTDVQFALINTGSIEIPLVIKNAFAEKLRIVSVMPGQAAHYIQWLEARNYSFKELLTSFWPLRSIGFNKIYFIKDLICNTQALEGKNIIADSCCKRDLELQNVILFIDKDRLIKFFFEVKNEKAWGGFARKTPSKIKNEKDVRVTYYPLDEDATKKYKQLCQDLYSQISVKEGINKDSLATLIEALKTA